MTLALMTVQMKTWTWPVRVSISNLKSYRYCRRTPHGWNDIHAHLASVSSSAGSDLSEEDFHRIEADVVGTCELVPNLIFDTLEGEAMGVAVQMSVHAHVYAVFFQKF
jgi:hypothetical protein